MVLNIVLAALWSEYSVTQHFSKNTRIERGNHHERSVTMPIFTAIINEDVRSVGASDQLLIACKGICLSDPVDSLVCVAWHLSLVRLNWDHTVYSCLCCTHLFCGIGEVRLRASRGDMVTAARWCWSWWCVGVIPTRLPLVSAPCEFLNSCERQEKIRFCPHFYTLLPWCPSLIFLGCTEVWTCLIWCAW